MGGLGKYDQKETYKNLDKNEPSLRNFENCTLGFNEIIKITISEIINVPSNEALKNNNENLEKNEYPSFAEEQKITNKLSGVFSNPNSSNLFNASESEANEETKNHEKNDMISKKIHSVENLTDPSLKINKISDFSN